MHEIEQWIQEAIRSGQLRVSRLPKTQAAKLVSDVVEKFLNSRPRSWWLDLKTPPQRISSGSNPLWMVVPRTEEQLYFIPETEEEELPVFRGSILELERLVSECPFFEYYVIAPNLAWLIIETDHNEYLLCGDLSVEPRS